MNCVIYYSNTGQSKRIAEYLAEKTTFPLFDMFHLTEYDFDTVVLVFPVHCQNIPDHVKNLLKQLHAKHLAVIVTYGKMCYGNVLHEIQKHYEHNIIAAAYVPTKHSYLTETDFTDFEALIPIVTKIHDPTPITIPKSYKNPFADICIGLRSRIGVKIIKDEHCDNCGTCNTVCDNSAIVNGKTNRKCIRCLKCVTQCPKNALHTINRLPMRMYLRKKKTDKTVIYI